MPGGSEAGLAFLVKGHLVLDGSVVFHQEHYFFIACVLPQKNMALMMIVVESYFLMNAHSLMHCFVDCCIESKFFVD